MLLYCRYVFEKILIILEETMKKTKIICTMGPNTNDRNLIKDLALAGMDIARFNFSHGDHEEQAGRFALIKSEEKNLISLLQLFLILRDLRSEQVLLRMTRRLHLLRDRNIH